MWRENIHAHAYFWGEKTQIEYVESKDGTKIMKYLID